MPGEISPEREENTDDYEDISDNIKVLRARRVLRLKNRNLPASVEGNKILVQDRPDGRRYYVCPSGRYRSLPTLVAELCRDSIARAMSNYEGGHLREGLFLQYFDRYMARARREIGIDDERLESWRPKWQAQSKVSSSASAAPHTSHPMLPSTANLTVLSSSSTSSSAPLGDLSDFPSSMAPSAGPLEEPSSTPSSSSAAPPHPSQGP